MLSLFQERRCKSCSKTGIASSSTTFLSNSFFVSLRCSMFYCFIVEHLVLFSILSCSLSSTRPGNKFSHHSKNFIVLLSARSGAIFFPRKQFYDVPRCLSNRLLQLFFNFLFFLLESSLFTTRPKPIFGWRHVKVHQVQLLNSCCLRSIISVINLFVFF